MLCHIDDRRPFSIHIESLSTLIYSASWSIFHHNFRHVSHVVLRLLQLDYTVLKSKVTAEELLWQCILPFRFQKYSHFPTCNHKSSQTILAYVRVSRDVSIETPAWLDELCSSWLDRCSHFCVLIEIMNMDALSREIKPIDWKFWPLNIASVNHFPGLFQSSFIGSRHAAKIKAVIKCVIKRIIKLLSVEYSLIQERRTCYLWGIQTPKPGQNFQIFKK